MPDNPDRPGWRNALAARVVTIPTDLVTGVAFFLLGLVLYCILPDQIQVAQNEVVNGRAFPKMLIVLMMACSLGLVGKDVVKRLRHEPVATKTINLLVEVKALIIFAILLTTYILDRLTGLFVVGALFCCVAFLLYFRCSKPRYYAITLTSAVIIWVSFRFFLNVDF